MRTFQQRVLKTQDAAEYVALSASYLEKLRLRGGGPRFVRFGRRAVRYHVDDLDAWLDGQRDIPSVRAPLARGRAR